MMTTTTATTTYFLDSRITPLHTHTHHHHTHRHQQHEKVTSKRMMIHKPLVGDSSSSSSSSSSSMEDLVKSTTPNSVTMYPSSSSSSSSTAMKKNSQGLTSPTVSKSIKICSTSMQRTASELQLLQDEAVADYRDYCFYARLCKGIQEHPTCPNSAETLRNLKKTRSTSTSLLSLSSFVPPPLPSMYHHHPTTTTTATTTAAATTTELNYLQTAHDIVSNNTNTDNTTDYCYYYDLDNTTDNNEQEMDYSDTIIMDYYTTNMIDNDNDNEDDGVFDMDL